ncbi:Acryloyl-coenzyme A reductase [Pseudocercospora fuligena]|uniref:Acryloyl-coenzyme A reductase n=1 Tax=Pseudocercospora fuligena TaxID=685502 RepID=A0A8H6VEU9_9PEZI|nr:Acryloyl-coenzyme A reductase [Pseudocercospora fuligena]
MPSVISRSAEDRKASRYIIQAKAKPYHLPTKPYSKRPYVQPLIVKSLPTPQPTSGSIVLKILFSPVISYMRDVYNGVRKYAYPNPLVPGTSAIARVAATGPDTVLLKVGDLVYFDCTIHGRDDYDSVFLMGLSQGGTEGSVKLMEGEWREGTFAEFARVPLENVFKLDKERLIGELGYEVPQLCWVLQALVPYGGLRSIGLQAGETVVVAPATGEFGSAAVVVALAMGARVIAMGRNKEALEGLKRLGDRVHTVQMTGDAEAEMKELKKFVIMSLKRGGRVSLMGGLHDDLPIPHRYVMRRDITIKGKWMYLREDNLAFLSLITSGVLNVRDVVKVVGKFKLDDWEEAFQLAWDNGRLGQMVVFAP